LGGGWRGGTWLLGRALRHPGNSRRDRGNGAGAPSNSLHASTIAKSFIFSKHLLCKNNFKPTSNNAVQAIFNDFGLMSRHHLSLLLSILNFPL
jgi:hypothetical protein